MVLTRCGLRTILEDFEHWVYGFFCQPALRFAFIVITLLYRAVPVLQRSAPTVYWFLALLDVGVRKPEVRPSSRSVIHYTDTQFLSSVRAMVSRVIYLGLR